MTAGVAERRFVIDANVLFSAVFKPGGRCARLVDAAARGELALHAPQSVRAELLRVLQAKAGLSPSDAARATALLPVVWAFEIEYAGLLPLVEGSIRDEDDLPLVAVALLLDVPIVTGDRGFHPMRRAIVETRKPSDVVG